MLAKIWKKVCLAILLLACLFNVVFKIVNKVSLNKELVSSAQYMYEEYKYEKEENELKTKVEELTKIKGINEKLARKIKEEL